MGFGALIFRRVGAFIRWIFIGFKGRYNDVLEGPNCEDPIDSASYELVTKVIGFITIVVLGILLSEY
jgi:hypothetical protein